MDSLLISSVLCGLLGYLFLFRDGWEFLILTVGFLGLFWTLGLKWMSDAYGKKLLYKLVEGGGHSGGVEGGVRGTSNETIIVDIQKREATCVEVPWRQLLKQGPIL